MTCYVQWNPDYGKRFPSPGIELGTARSARPGLTHCDTEAP